MCEVWQSLLELKISSTRPLSAVGMTYIFVVLLADAALGVAEMLMQSPT